MSAWTSRGGFFVADVHTISAPSLIAKRFARRRGANVEHPVSDLMCLREILRSGQRSKWSRASSFRTSWRRDTRNPPSVSGSPSAEDTSSQLTTRSNRSEEFGGLAGARWDVHRRLRHFFFANVAAVFDETRELIAREIERGRPLRGAERCVSAGLLTKIADRD